MLQIVLIVALIVSAFGWFNRFVANLALIHWLVVHDQKMPDDEELLESAIAVLRHFLKLD